MLIRDEEIRVLLGIAENRVTEADDVLFDWQRIIRVVSRVQEAIRGWWIETIAISPTPAIY